MQAVCPGAERHAFACLLVLIIIAAVLVLCCLRKALGVVRVIVQLIRILHVVKTVRGLCKPRHIINAIALSPEMIRRCRARVIRETERLRLLLHADNCRFIAAAAVKDIAALRAAHCDGCRDAARAEHCRRDRSTDRDFSDFPFVFPLFHCAFPFPGCCFGTLLPHIVRDHVIIPAVCVLHSAADPFLRELHSHPSSLKNFRSFLRVRISVTVTRLCEMPKASAISRVLRSFP